MIILDKSLLLFLCFSFCGITVYKINISIKVENILCAIFLYKYVYFVVGLWLLDKDVDIDELKQKIEEVDNVMNFCILIMKFLV